MNIRIKDLEKLDQIGVYAMINNRTNKVYIGSTRTSFKKRLNIHLMRLKNNNHENKYLNYAYNKDSKYFEFRILHITDNNLKWEQRAIDIFKPFKKRGYNINPFAAQPPINITKEVIKKRANTFKITINEAIKYYRLLQNNEIEKNDIPIKYRNLACSYINKTIWNKGKKYDLTNHLKVPKKIKGNRDNFTKTMMKKSYKIEVLDLNMISLGIWENTYDLVEWSKTNILPIKSRFSVSRMNIKIHELQYDGIRKAARKNTSYKGLFFKFIEPS